MTNNQILHEILRVTNLQIKDALKCFRLINKKITLEDVQDVLKAEDEENYVYLSDEGMLLFLDGFIAYHRGKSDKKAPDAYLTTNLILKKLRVAFNLKEEDLLKIYLLAGLPLTKNQLGAYFRAENHPNFKKLSFAKLRKFFKGYKLYKEA